MELEYPSGVAAKEDKVDQNAAPEPRLKKVGLLLACAVGAHRAPTRAARASAKDFAERSVSNMKHPSPPEALKFYLETGRW